MEESDLKTQSLNDLEAINKQMKASASCSDAFELMLKLPDLWPVLSDPDKSKMIRTIFTP
ncbi:hypothetical protein [Brevibacillus laterosporus]|uniref:hypothetical protein n=1 Tax=Brevibacillus laterosporus TaxID=1465 RepID=UPI000EB30263|nr:hypothetical protein [Brevibacillus laterosporus]AYK08649.1 hypothetical protein D8Z77_21110 [Brevibacillus laterosporus]